MAKIRVYELARDLNLTNQELVDKISDLGIEVTSHMSSLDDEAVASIKAGIFGKKKEQLEEVRIKPTVIRRRKKTETKKADAGEEDVESKVAVETDVEPEEEVAAEPKIDEQPVETSTAKEELVKEESVEKESVEIEPKEKKSK
jgi:translation initiation factor IF-2